MTDAEYQFFRLFWDDPKVSTLIGRIILVAIIVSIFLERKTKFKPWTRLIQWIGRTANRQVMDRMDQLEGKVDKIQLDQQDAREESRRADHDLKGRMDLEKAESARRRILRFADEIENGMPHSKEMFDDVLEDIDTYRSYYDDPAHKNIKNGRARHAAKLIEDCYQERLQKHDFLIGSRK